MQPSRYYAIVGVVAVTLILVLAIVLFRSGSNLTEIAIGDKNRCEYAPHAKQPNSLMVGPCEKNDAGNCRFNASIGSLEIKATFPPARITNNPAVNLIWEDNEVTWFEARREGLTCPDNEDKKEQSLDWKPDIKLNVGRSYFYLAVYDGAVFFYCVEFPAEVVA